jgi:hypothetical protein
VVRASGGSSLSASVTPGGGGSSVSLAVINTGGGGYSGANGASGLVIVRYPS